MRILDLQRRLREVGRIRIGEKTTSRNGKQIPVKLQTFRLTSRDRQVIDAAAELWGGTATEWADAPDGGQWQVTTETDSMSVIVPPGDMSFSQAYEQWNAGGCKVRCDGRWDHVGDTACHCAPDNRACDIHTRLSVILPDLPGLGVWRLDTQGYYAAVELGGIADICAQAAGAGRMLPARLRLEQRSVKRIDNGKVETRRFAVPVLDVDVHPLALTGGVDGATGELSTPVAIRGELPSPNITPVPAAPDGALAPSIAEQMASVETVDRPARANAAQPVPPTGLRPRTAREAEADETAPRETGPPAEGEGAGSSTATRDEPAPEPAERTAAVNVSDVARYSTKVFKAAYDAAPKGDKTKVVDRLRHAVTYAVSGGRVTSLNDLEPAELVRVNERLRYIEDGRMAYATDEEGVTFVLIANGRETSIRWADLEPNEAA